MKKLFLLFLFFTAWVSLLFPQKVFAAGEGVGMILGRPEVENLPSPGDKLTVTAVLYNADTVFTYNVQAWAWVIPTQYIDPDASPKQTIFVLKPGASQTLTFTFDVVSNVCQTGPVKFEATGVYTYYTEGSPPGDEITSSSSSVTLADGIGATLNVQVLKSNGFPAAGASVSITGTYSDTRTTDVNGWVKFRRLNCTRDNYVTASLNNENESGGPVNFRSSLGNLCNGQERNTTIQMSVQATPTPTPPACGDGICNGNETCSTCSTDCGTCLPTPTPIPTTCTEGASWTPCTTSACSPTTTECAQEVYQCNNRGGWVYQYAVCNAPVCGSNCGTPPPTPTPLPLPGWEGCRSCTAKYVDTINPPYPGWDDNTDPDYAQPCYASYCGGGGCQVNNTKKGPNNKSVCTGNPSYCCPLPPPPSPTCSLNENPSSPALVGQKVTISASATRNIAGVSVTKHQVWVQQLIGDTLANNPLCVNGWVKYCRAQSSQQKGYENYWWYWLGEVDNTNPATFTWETNGFVTGTRMITLNTWFSDGSHLYWIDDNGNLTGCSNTYSLNPAPTPIPTYSISGYTWVDQNNDGVKQGGESCYNEGNRELTLNLTNKGTLTYTSDQNCSNLYTYSNLPRGDYTLSITNPLSYYSTENCPGSKTFAPLNSNQTYNFCLVQGSPWWQTKLGDVRAGGGILTDRIPTAATSPYVSLTDGSAGIVGYVGSADFGTGPGKASIPNWQVNSAFSGSTYFYDYFSAKLGPSATPFDGKKPSGSGTFIYQANGDTSISDPSWNTSVSQNQKIIILVNRNLTLNREISVQKGGFLAFFVKGNIIVDPSLKSPANSTSSDLEGVYVADGSFNTGSAKDSAARLNIEGTVIAGRLNQYRDLQVKNSESPAFYVSYRPDLLLNAPDLLQERQFTWQEIVP